MDLELIKNILMVAGGIALGLPAFLSALVAFFMLIPGEHPEDWIKKIIPYVEKISEVVGKFSKK